MNNLKKKVISRTSILLVLMFLIFSNVNTVYCATYTNDVIPAMASNNSPSGLVTASADNGTWAPWKAFSDTLDDYGWSSNDGSGTGWLAYEFPTAKVISKYTISAASYTTNYQYAPKDWQFQGFDEATGQWVTLDTRSGQVGWVSGEKREYTLSNTTSYKNYKINITAGNLATIIIGEMEMMTTVTLPVKPLNLTATPGDTQITLTWDAVEGATSYNVKRSDSATGTYITIKTNETGTSFVDTGLTNGSTYYYKVSAVNSDGEGSESDYVTAIPQSQGGNRAILKITMINGIEKEYDLSMTQINAFLDWYDGRANGTGKAYYCINKTYNIKPFLSRKDYIVFDKILDFEIKDYNE